MLLRAGIACGNMANWLGLLVRASRAHKEQQSRARWQPAADDTIVVVEEPKSGQVGRALEVEGVVGAKNLQCVEGVP